MPVYEYRCRNCGATFDVLVRSGTAIACPHCGSSALDKMLSAPYVSNGQTARQAGHTCCGREERCASPPCAGESGCRRG